MTATDRPAELPTGGVEVWEPPCNDDMNLGANQEMVVLLVIFTVIFDVFFALEWCFRGGFMIFLVIKW